jgi:hypothetical protein
MSLEMAHKVILPPKKNYIPQFLKQRDINSYSISDWLIHGPMRKNLWPLSVIRTTACKLWRISYRERFVKIRRGKLQEEDDLQNRLSNAERKIADSIAKYEELNSVTVD